MLRRCEDGPPDTGARLLPALQLPVESRCPRPGERRVRCGARGTSAAEGEHAAGVHAPRVPRQPGSCVVKSVGILCNCTADQDPRQQLSPSLVNRAFLIDEHLAPMGIRVFLYSPKDVTANGEVPGYMLEGHDVVAARQTVPRVNANRTYATRRLIEQGMGYSRFKAWVRESGIGIYVPYEFSELVSNKRKAYDVVRGFNESLHPHTETLTGGAQIES